MSRIIAVVLLLLVLLTVVGIVLPAIYRAREEEEFRRCQDHLRRIVRDGLPHSNRPGSPVPVEAQNYLPAATMVEEGLAVERRLSWYPTIIAAMDRGPVTPGEQNQRPTKFGSLPTRFDPLVPWDEEPNRAAAGTRLTFALCPAQRPAGIGGIAPTNYPANGGIGADAPSLSIEQAGNRAGAFRYDTPTPLEAIRDADGLSHTLAVGETASDLGPWIQGGPATVRALDAEATPYLGAGRQYSGCHRSRGNFAMVDGSVRVLTDRIDGVIFVALLSIQGN